jgi:hypothetical protein
MNHNDSAYYNYCIKLLEIMHIIQVQTLNIKTYLTVQRKQNVNRLTESTFLNFEHALKFLKHMKISYKNLSIFRNKSLLSLHLNGVYICPVPVFSATVILRRVGSGRRVHR